MRYRGYTLDDLFIAVIVGIGVGFIASMAVYVFVAHQ
jgi:hypothetical protein